ncbi:MAG TPA: PEGA domain-containing protein, partial [Kofleriaceae bacterium]
SLEPSLTPSVVSAPVTPAVVKAPSVEPIAVEPIAESAPAPQPQPVETAPAPQPPPVETASAPPPAVEPASRVETSTATRQLPVSSQPAGATITLIENGVASVVGQTPLAVTIDPARSYDIVLTHAGYRTQLMHVDRRTKELAIALAAEGATQQASTEPRESRREPSEPKRATSTQAKRSDKPSTSALATTPAPRPARVATASSNAGEGTLMVSTKPPCEIAIDGVATMLTTPQRSIKLRAGKHKVTLFNTSRNIDTTIEVVIEARKPTKLIRDFMPKSQ